MAKFTHSYTMINSDGVNEAESEWKSLNLKSPQEEQITGRDDGSFGDIVWKVDKDATIVAQYINQRTSCLYIFSYETKTSSGGCFIASHNRGYWCGVVNTSTLYIMNEVDAANVMSVIHSVREPNTDFVNEFKNYEEAEELLEYIIELLGINYRKLSGRIRVVAEDKKRVDLNQCIEEIRRYRKAKVRSSIPTNTKWYQFWK